MHPWPLILRLVFLSLMTMPVLAEASPARAQADADSLAFERWCAWDGVNLLGEAVPIDSWLCGPDVIHGAPPETIVPIPIALLETTPQLGRVAPPTEALNLPPARAVPSTSGAQRGGGRECGSRGGP